jgi:GntR family transcriptional regulator, transcriptional repressor for pyruvate dehydrogenase complex
MTSVADPGRLPPDARERGRQRRSPTKSSFLLADSILRDIVDEDLAPGDPLPLEREMSARYEVGRGTVREALRLLEYQGAVRLRQGVNGGPFVQEPDSTHLATMIVFLMRIQRTPFKSIVEVRSAIEPMICRLAAERVTDEALDELGRTIREMDRLKDQHADTHGFNDLNTRFHNVIAWSSGNALFRYLADSLLDIMDGAVVGLRYSENSRRGVIAAHESIYSALRQHDPGHAEKAMQEHLLAWQKYAEQNYPEALEQVIPWTSGAQ